MNIPRKDKTTTIYTDASELNDYSVCAWGCVIIHNDEEHIFSDYCVDTDAMWFGKFYAVLKSLEMLSNFDDVKDVRIYTEDSSIVVNYEIKNKGKKPELIGYYDDCFKRLCEFSTKYKLTVMRVPPNQNRAHHIANFTLREAVPKVIEEKRLAAIAIAAQKWAEQSPLTIIKKCIPQSLKMQGDFNSYINRVLNSCAKNDGFNYLLSSQGVSMVSFYQLLKNRFPKKISYKEHGEKKLHMALALALKGSEFCVTETDGVFHINFRSKRPENAQVVEWIPSESNSKQ